LVQVPGARKEGTGAAPELWNRFNRAAINEDSDPGESCRPFSGTRKRCRIARA